MRFRLGILFCSLALLQILGGHWVLLQTSAWVGMAVQYSQQLGLKAGLAETFDGEHPCPVCKAIQDGKKQERKKAPLLQAQLKKDFLAVCNSFQVYQGWAKLNYPGFTEQFLGVAHEPAVPPPRS
jgi:hypothetical protein